MAPITPPRPASASGEPPRISIEKWAALPEDEPGELVDGRLMEEEVTDYAHDTVVSFVNALMHGWVVPRGGFVAGSDAKFAVGEHQGRKPDLSVYLPGKRVPPRHGPVRVPPDIIVEVLSPLPLDVRRDRLEKSRDYAAFGVPWYWIIDPAQKTLEIFELGSDQRYAYAFAVAEGCVALPGCDGLTLDVDRLWAEIDRLDPSTKPTAPPATSTNSSVTSTAPDDTATTIAARIAVLLSTATNVSAVIDNPPTLHATDRRELRSTLLWIADELGTIAGSLTGLSWPSDGHDPIERLRTLASAWDPAVPPPSEVLDAARQCIRVLHQNAPKP